MASSMWPVPNASPTSNNAAVTFHDVITSTIVGSYSRRGKASEDTIFRVFKDNGYTT